jgi:hypothetical protein
MGGSNLGRRGGKHQPAAPFDLVSAAAQLDFGHRMFGSGDEERLERLRELWPKAFLPKTLLPKVLGHGRAVGRAGRVVGRKSAHQSISSIVYVGRNVRLAAYEIETTPRPSS